MALRPAETDSACVVSLVAAPVAEFEVELVVELVVALVVDPVVVELVIVDRNIFDPHAASLAAFH